MVLALVACLFTAFSIGELAKHLPSAGGMYTYVGNGLGSFAGWLMAWAFLLAEPLVAPILFAAFGFYGALAAPRSSSGSRTTALAAARDPVCGDRVVPDLPRDLDLDAHRGDPRRDRDRDLRRRLGAADRQRRVSRNTLSVFVPGDAGLKPALQGMVFCLLAFVGFEAAAPLGEEARDPKRTIRQAVIWLVRR